MCCTFTVRAWSPDASLAKSGKGNSSSSLVFSSCVSLPVPTPVDAFLNARGSVFFTVSKKKSSSGTVARMDSSCRSASNTFGFANKNRVPDCWFWKCVRFGPSRPLVLSHAISDRNAVAQWLLVVCVLLLLRDISPSVSPSVAPVVPGASPTSFPSARSFPFPQKSSITHHPSLRKCARFSLSIFEYHRFGVRCCGSRKGPGKTPILAGAPLAGGGEVDPGIGGVHRRKSEARFSASKFFSEKHPRLSAFWLHSSGPRLANHRSPTHRANKISKICRSCIFSGTRG